MVICPICCYQPDQLSRANRNNAHFCQKKGGAEEHAVGAVMPGSALQGLGLAAQATLMLGERGLGKGAQASPMQCPVFPLGNLVTLCTLLPLASQYLFIFREKF